MPTLDDCADGAGSINNPTLANGGLPSTPQAYVAPDLCIPDYRLAECDGDSAYQEQVAAENLAISGAPVNIFKLLGIHEQGKLIDLTGTGAPLGGSTAANAFDSLAGNWTSLQVGLAVVSDPAYIGYDFGARLTSYGQPEYAPDQNVLHHITSFRIQQGTVATTRALQVRVDRSTGGYRIDPLKVQFTGIGNGSVGSFIPGAAPLPGMLMLAAVSATQFSVIFTGSSTSVLGVATVGQRFNSSIGSLTITAGTIPYAVGDMFSAPIELEWLRVDVVNLPNSASPALIRIKQSAPSRYWRLVPLSFAGAMSGDAWVIDKLELMDYQATRLDDIQDELFMENRDRDYAKVAIEIKAAYTPFDGVSDFGKFGFSVADIYTFSTTFATMVTALGRPIVVGDVLELPAELQYDHNLKPVRKFLEVSDVTWSSEGFTTSWRPIIYRFQAQQLIPSQENRDIVGTVDTQKYGIDDSSFFDNVNQQIQTVPLTATEKNEQDAIAAVPEKGISTREQMSGTNRFNQPGSYDGVGPYVESGLPPDGQPYTSGFVLPDVAGRVDGEFFRLEYDPKLNIQARLYKFNSIKNKWLYASTDRRGQRSAHKPSQLAILNLDTTLSLTKKVT